MLLAAEGFELDTDILGPKRFHQSCFQLFTRQLLFGLAVCFAMIPTFASRWTASGGPFETGYVSIRDFLWRSSVFSSVVPARGTTSLGQ